MAKAKDAFRTISEVAEWLDTPTHVLRFWETKFSQIKPVKGAGSRRYYRPADMELLSGIKQLLHEDGLTIKGVQKILREQGVKHVATLGRMLDASDAPEVTPPAPTVETAPAPQPTAPDPLPDDDAPAVTLPAMPAEITHLPARMFGLRLVDQATLRARAAQIAPLLARLDALRQQMHTQ